MSDDSLFYYDVIPARPVQANRATTAGTHNEMTRYKMPIWATDKPNGAHLYKQYN
jgi:hypothetical protein